MAKRKESRLKASEAHWKLMEAVSTAVAKEKYDPQKAAMAMAELLFEAYEKDLLLVISSVHQPETVRIHLPETPKHPGVVSIQQSERISQAYIQTELGRMYLFYTSREEGAKRAPPGSTWNICSARDVLGNILNRRNVAALAVDEVIVPSFLLVARFAETPRKPENFVPEK